MKGCPGCGVSKALDEFHRHKSSRDGRQTYCKSCTKKRDHIRWKNADGSTREDRAIIAKKNYAKNGHKYRSNAHYKMYGITVEARDAIYSRQHGLCLICADDLRPRVRKGRVSKYAWKGELDHNHETGEIRGLLCAPCNTALGLLKEDPVRITRMLEYLNG